MLHQPYLVKMRWSRLAAMVAVSTAAMFILMYQLVYTPADALFSLNRLIASLAMGCVMTAIMVGFMWSMYDGRTAKTWVVLLATVGAAGLLYVNRSQSLVGDRAFMRAMIPHHSIAINNARKAHISDPRVRELADQIIASQVREIAEMKLLLADIGDNGERGAAALPARPVVVTKDMQPQIRDAVS